MTEYLPEQQIQLLKDQCKNLSSEIYNVTDLYLKLVRSILPKAVKQAIFLLITQYNDNQSDAFDLNKNKNYLSKIDKHVLNALSQLTIEQLILIAKSIEKERIISKLDGKKILKNEENDDDEFSYQNNYNLQSVVLSSKSPLENPKIIEKSFMDPKEVLSVDLELANNKNYQFKNIKNSNLTDKDTNEINLINNSLSRSIKAIKNIFIDSKNYSNKINDKQFKDKDKDKDKDKEMININKDISDKNKSYLPHNPMELHKWINLIETALVRNLRNLSNAINIELLSAGLINNLMPLSIFDAVLGGQLITQDAPSNILRITVPINNSLPDDGVEISCIFIRTSELEFDSPLLRKYKSSLKQYRNLLLRMTKQYRHWKGRSLSDEFSKQWLDSTQGQEKQNPY